MQNKREYTIPTFAILTIGTELGFANSLEDPIVKPETDW